MQLQGRLVYPDGTIDVSNEQVDEAFKAQFRQAIGLLSSATSPRKVPSFQECRFCDISEQYCPERMEGQPDAALEEHDLF
jgi:hypothetical protein